MNKKFSVTWRGKKFILDMEIARNLKELGDALQRLTNVKPDSMRLIVPTNKASRLFYPFSEGHSYLDLELAHISEGKSILMLGVPENEVDELIQSSKVNHRIAGFDEEEKRLRRRISDGTNSWPKLPEGSYIFSEFRTLDLPGIELKPSAEEALKLMHRLAADPGIVAIMSKHRWKVGIMSEMAPIGYVGVTPECILGFNKNHGEEISLRLRTDDLNGFRKYESIKKTLLHELAHMVHSEHDANFYALDKQLNEEAANLDWTKAKGHTLTGVKHSLYSDREINSHGSSSQKLGGQVSTFSNASAASVAAAYHRIANASSNDLEASYIQKEPGKDDSRLTISQEHKHMHLEEKMETSITHTDSVQKWSDAHDSSYGGFTPDPDDSEGKEVMISEPSLHTGGNGSNTVPQDDHSEVTALKTVAGEELPPKDLLVVPVIDGIIAGSESSGATECLGNLDELKLISLEPQPDDSKLRENEVDYKDAERPDCDISPPEDNKNEMQAAFVSESFSGEPDPDDSQASTEVQSEHGPDADINVFPKSNMSESEVSKPTRDSDDTVLQIIQDPVTALCGRLQKAIEMLRSELDPSAAASTLHTIFRILRNMTEHPDELKFRKLRKANPVIQKNIVNHRAAIEIMHLIGFVEDETSNGETYLILKRTDPGLLWLVKTLLESYINPQPTTL